MCKKYSAFKLSSCATTVLHAHADIFVKRVRSFFRHERSRSLVEDPSIRKHALSMHLSDLGLRYLRLIF